MTSEIYLGRLQNGEDKAEDNMIIIATLAWTAHHPEELNRLVDLAMSDSGDSSPSVVLGEEGSQ